MYQYGNAEVIDKDRPKSVVLNDLISFNIADDFHVAVWVKINYYMHQCGSAVLV